jgi:hypothetical protein
MSTRCLAAVVLASLLASFASAQAPGDRAAKVRNDREAFKNSERWVYNNLEQGIAEAKQTNKPLLVVFRCIPCEACAGFDEQVARRDAQIDDLMNQFVCVRIVQGNAMDLSLFQFDYDMSFAAFFLNADRTIYGRFGSMSNHDDAERDISMEGFRKTLLAALDLHKNYPANKASLVGKHGPAPRYPVPEAYPTFSQKYTSKLDYEGKVVQSCIHCHQIRNVEQEFVRNSKQPFSDKLLSPWPMPNFVGLALSKTDKAKVTSVTAGSVAELAGFRAGDELLTLEGQPLVSIADVQWVMHNAPEPSELKAEVLRDGKTVTLTLPLENGWRLKGDFSWRPTAWSFRGMIGGLFVGDIPNDERQAAKIDEKKLALRVKYVGEYGDHALAKKAGFKKGDVIVEVDGKTARMGESEWFEYLLRQRKPGDLVPVVIEREGQRIELKLPLRPLPS